MNRVKIPTFVHLLEIRNREPGALRKYEWNGREIRRTLDQLPQKVKAVLEVQHVGRRLVNVLGRAVHVCVNRLSQFIYTVQGVQDIRACVVKAVVWDAFHGNLERGPLRLGEGEVALADERFPVGVDLVRLAADVLKTGAVVSKHRAVVVEFDATGELALRHLNGRLSQHCEGVKLVWARWDEHEETYIIRWNSQ